MLPRYRKHVFFAVFDSYSYVTDTLAHTEIEIVAYTALAQRQN